MLRFALDNGIIDLATIESEIEDMERESILKMHTNNVWQGKNGKWYTYLGNGGDRKLLKRNTLEEIENVIIDTYSEEFYRNSDDNICVEDIFIEWINAKLEIREICRGTYDRYFCEYNKYFRGSEFSKRKIKLVTEDDIDEFLRQQIINNYMTHKMFANIRTILAGIFKYAKRKHLTEISISTFLKDFDVSRKAFKPGQYKPNAIFTDEEMEKLISYLYSDPTIMNLGLLLAFQTGVRCGELASLKFSDMEDKQLHIQRQEILYKSDTDGIQTHKVVDYTKTEAGDRFIYLPDNAVSTIQMARKLHRGEWIFMKDGKRIQKTAFNRYLSNACKAVNIAPRTMHKIRRTYGTTLIDNNVEDSLIMSQMGHKSIETTRKYYYFANRNDEHKREQIVKSITW